MEICPHIFIYEIKKSIFHIWNMHLYYHTWNIENSIFIHEVCTWLGPLFRPWNLGSHGFNGWTVMDLKRPDRVPLIKWPVTSTVWFNLAGTTVPSALRGWYPDPLALRTLEKSPNLQVSWCWGPQLKPRECSLLPERAVSRHLRHPQLGAATLVGISLGLELWSFRGRSSETQAPLSVAQAHSTWIHSGGGPLSLMLWLPPGTRVGQEKVLPLVDIFCNSNLTTRAYRHL